MKLERVMLSQRSQTKRKYILNEFIHTKILEKCEFIDSDKKKITSSLESVGAGRPE